MNKLYQGTNFYRRSPMPWNPSKEKLQSGLEFARSSTKKIAVKNAYDSVCAISRQFNIPVVTKTFGKGIIRVACRTFPQLENIALIIRELIKFGLIEQIGMPLECSASWTTLVLFLKPTDGLNMRLDEVFRICSFEYHHLMIDVKHPAATKQSFKIKIIAVQNAYFGLRQILNEFNIPCVKKTEGSAIVRVSCRSVVQLDNITSIMKKLLKTHLIAEIGMPLEHSFKMKSLVLFLKPTNMKSSMKLDLVFQKSSFEYYYRVIDIKISTAAAAKENSKKVFNSMPIINATRPIFEETNPIESIWFMIIRLVTFISMLILTYELSAAGPQEVLLLF